MSFKTEKMSFEGSMGFTIDAKLERPIGETKGYAIFAHCFTCSKDVHAATRISRALTKNGIAVLRFDFTGLGNSDGDFSNTNFSTNVTDLICAYRYLAGHFKAPEILIGHSLGGAAALSAVSSMQAIKLVATIAAPSDVSHIENLLAGKLEQIESEGEAQITLAGRTFTIRNQFLKDIRSISVEDRIHSINASLMIFHSPQDKVVSIDHAFEIYQKAKYPKSMICLNGAGHLLDQARDSEYVASVISSWCQRYLAEETETNIIMTDEEKIDQSLMESFPASDPPGYMSKSSVDQEQNQI